MECKPYDSDIIHFDKHGAVIIPKEAVTVIT